MKRLDKYSRLAGYLEKLYDKLNADFFDGQLTRPVITIQSTPRAYGHYSLFDAWDVDGVGKREINIGAGTLDRTIEEIVATLVHEMCHQLADQVLKIQDCSRGGRYHNINFKQIAEDHGLLVTKTEKYGYAHTTPSNDLIDWIIDNDVMDIFMNRNERGSSHAITGGNSTASGVSFTGTKPKSNSRRYICPCCMQIVRATRIVNVVCGNCLETMIEA